VSLGFRSRTLGEEAAGIGFAAIEIANTNVANENRQTTGRGTQPTAVRQQHTAATKVGRQPEPADEQGGRSRNPTTGRGRGRRGYADQRSKRWIGGNGGRFASRTRRRLVKDLRPGDDR